MRLAIGVCGNFEPEARRVLALPGLGDGRQPISLLTLPATCGRPPLTIPALQAARRRAGLEGPVELVVGPACSGLNAPCEGFSVNRLGQCFHLVAPAALVDHLLAAGAYLVTPGWLAHWRARLAQLGLDDATAAAMFAETVRRIVLLDTGVDPRSGQALRELSGALALPAETVPVGLEHMRLFLAGVVARTQLDHERAEALAGIGLAHRRSADYAAAFDLLGTLTAITVEGEAMRRALDAFTMLFAPGRAAFVQVVDGVPRAVVSHPPREVDAVELLGRLRAGGDGLLAGEGKLLLPVRHSGELLGVISLEEIAAPHHLDRDHALALTIASVCGLALSNARKYEAIRQADRERAETSALLRMANVRLVEADRHKDDFLTMLSHELRNPLAPILSAVHILERAAPGGPELGRARAIIARQARHLTRLVDDLLDVTRIARGKIRLQRELVDLGAIVRGAAEDQREVFGKRGVTLDLSVPAGPVFVEADPTRIAQILDNLLQNAVKFTSPGGNVQLRLEPAGEGVATLEVHDDGVGIEPELLAGLFEPFMQAETTLDRSRGGLGLGLALVKGLAELHGGSVGARSEGTGKGATFTVRLPLAATGPQEATAAAPTRSGAARRVLAIDDNADAAWSLKAALELEGHQVEVAGDGPEGIEKARALAPDVVLCDLGLPGLDGYEVARTLRADPALRHVLLVALSGYATPEDVRRCSEAGFDRHLAKPADPAALARLLAEQPDRR